MHMMLSALLAFARAVPVPKARLVAENAALRQQLAVYVRTQKRPKLSPADRVFWVFLGRVWSDWARALVIVKPATVCGWHRSGDSRTNAPDPPPQPRCETGISCAVRVNCIRSWARQTTAPSASWVPLCSIARTPAKALRSGAALGLTSTANNFPSSAMSTSTSRPSSCCSKTAPTPQHSDLAVAGPGLSQRS